MKPDIILSLFARPNNSFLLLFFLTLLDFFFLDFFFQVHLPEQKLSQKWRQKRFNNKRRRFPTI